MLLSKKEEVIKNIEIILKRKKNFILNATVASAFMGLIDNIIKINEYEGSFNNQNRLLTELKAKILLQIKQRNINTKPLMKLINQIKTTDN